MLVSEGFMRIALLILLLSVPVGAQNSSRTEPKGKSCGCSPVSDSRWATTRRCQREDPATTQLSVVSGRKYERGACPVSSTALKSALLPAGAETPRPDSTSTGTCCVAY